LWHSVMKEGGGDPKEGGGDPIPAK
jgi:hypothetical protein